MWSSFGQFALVVVFSLLVVACGESSAQIPATVEPTPPVTLHPEALVTPTPPTPWVNPWSVTATPDHGPVGTRVHLDGDGFTEGFWANVELPGGYGIFLIGHFLSGQEFCELIARADFTIEISDTGHLVADFTVPAEGHCFQTDRGGPVRAGEYTIGIGCHACAVGTFRVTAAE